MYQAISWVLRLITALLVALDVVPTWLFSAHAAAETIVRSFHSIVPTPTRVPHMLIADLYPIAPKPTNANG